MDGQTGIQGQSGMLRDVVTGAQGWGELAPGIGWLVLGMGVTGAQGLR